MNPARAGRPKPALEALRGSLRETPREANGRWYFRETDQKGETSDKLDRVKLSLKRFPRLYAKLISVVAPVMGCDAPIRAFYDATPGVILNLGSGNQPAGPNTLNVDMFDYENVDVVADLHRLPFADDSVDGVISIAVLEHVRDPETALAEMHRVLKPGGRIFTLIPFMQPFHASPHDYQRYTLPGIEHLHRRFERVDAGVAGGPVSGFLWVFDEFVALLLSFGWRRLHHLVFITMMLLTWPLKYLDLLFRRLPTADIIASSFYVHGRKGPSPRP